MKKAERQIMLKQKLIDMSVNENDLYKQGVNAIAGIDEVGRGPLAGPVVAAAVVLPKGFDVLGVNDSKKLSAKKRDELFDIINETALAVSTAFISHETIDEVNILNATKQAMKDAIRDADLIYNHNSQSHIDYLLIDAVSLEGINIPQRSIIKGDEASVSIAAASIIAKVTRDRYMEEMDTKYPGYDFASNKGYGTKKHYEGLNKIGICPIHRKSFLKNFLDKNINLFRK